MSYQTPFDPEKALAATAYVAKNSGETMYPVLKMLYLVDKLHLERYGRPVTGDTYYAMGEGPTPSAIYDWMKYLRGERNFSTCPQASDFLSVDPQNHQISVSRMPDLDVLSASEIECLDEILKIYAANGKWDIRDKAHDAAWKATAQHAPMDIKTIAATVSDGPKIVQHLSERFQDK